MKFIFENRITCTDIFRHDYDEKNKIEIQKTLNLVLTIFISFTMIYT